MLCTKQLSEVYRSADIDSVMNLFLKKGQLLLNVSGLVMFCLCLWQTAKSCVYNMYIERVVNSNSGHVNILSLRRTATRSLTPILLQIPKFPK